MGTLRPGFGVRGSGKPWPGCSVRFVRNAIWPVERRDRKPPVGRGNSAAAMGRPTGWQPVSLCSTRPAPSARLFSSFRQKRDLADRVEEPKAALGSREQRGGNGPLHRLAAFSLCSTRRAPSALSSARLFSSFRQKRDLADRPGGAENRPWVEGTARRWAATTGWQPVSLCSTRRAPSALPSARLFSSFGGKRGFPLPAAGSAPLPCPTTTFHVTQIRHGFRPCPVERCSHS